MDDYTVLAYQPGFEHQHAAVARSAARDWIWPFACTVADLRRLLLEPDCDSDTWLYCFQGDRMVGVVTAEIHEPDERGRIMATIPLPRVLPGHELAADLLLLQLFDVLAAKNVARVASRVSTMWPGSFELVQRLGYRPSPDYPLGYRRTYTLDLCSARPPAPSPAVQDLDRRRDLDQAAELATHWYGQPADRCSQRLIDLQDQDIFIAHLGVRQGEHLIGACLAARNAIRPETLAGVYYIHTCDEACLQSLIPGVIARCQQASLHTLTVDLVGEHRQYESVYRSLDFVRAAEWEVYTRTLN